MMIEQEVDKIARSSGYKLTRFKGLQKRRSFMAKASGYVDRYASYMLEDDVSRQVMLACYKEPSAKALEHIRNSVSKFNRETIIYIKYPGGRTVLRNSGWF